MCGGNIKRTYLAYRCAAHLKNFPCKKRQNYYMYAPLQYTRYADFCTATRPCTATMESKGPHTCGGLTTTQRRIAQAERWGPRKAMHILGPAPRALDSAPGDPTQFVQTGSYSGGWAADLWDGEGRHDVKGGELYVGGFAGGQRHGYGALWVPLVVSPQPSASHCGSTTTHTSSTASGSNALGAARRKVYEGDWVGGVQHGQGVSFHPDGSVYEGGFSCGMKQGHGKMTYAADGSVYEGGWTAGVREGTGRLTLPNGDSYAGSWAAGEKQGEG